VLEGDELLVEVADVVLRWMRGRIGEESAPNKVADRHTLRRTGEADADDGRAPVRCGDARRSAVAGRGGERAVNDAA